MCSSRKVLALGVLVALFAALAVPASGERRPAPVSPGASDRSAVVEARCPTFLWSGVPGARGYELSVFRIEEHDAEPSLVTRTSVSGDARGWTPPSDQCLERGQRYAWSVTSVGAEADWSVPFLFEVEPAPSIEEVERAIATLQRYREQHEAAEPASLASTSEPGNVQESVGAILPRAREYSRELRAPIVPDRPVPGASTSQMSDVVRVTSAATPTIGIPSLRVSANVALGSSSNVFKNDQVFLWDDTTGNTALGRLALASATGDATNNTAVGREALRFTVPGILGYHGSSNTAVGYFALRSNASGFVNTASGAFALLSNTSGSGNTATGSDALRSNTTGSANTAIGRGALFFNTTGISNTASGLFALHSNTIGSSNTAIGFHALRSNTTGFGNTAGGHFALFSNTTGSSNAASGFGALANNTTGFSNSASGGGALHYNTTGYRNTATGESALFSNTIGQRNTAVGYGTGRYATTGHDNIFLGSGAEGVAGEGNTIRIGGTTTGGEEPGPGQQNRTFINGIRGMTTGMDDAITVLIDSNGQLGTVSSSEAAKQDVEEIGEGSRRLLELRPVSFRYRQHAASDPRTPLQYGLIAEEVAEVFPELVVYDDEGRPETVKYHLLAPLLLHELQRAERELGAARDALEEERRSNVVQDRRLEEQRVAHERAERQLAELGKRLLLLEGDEREAHQRPRATESDRRAKTHDSRFHGGPVRPHRPAEVGWDEPRP
jgi:hypothetical protein